jgi:hypothetical protein
MKEMFTESDRHFIGLLHDTINRMANNSANCKNWLLAILTAVVAYVASNPESSNLLWLIIIIDVLFYWLDSYYLQLENNFRDLEADFVCKVCNLGTQEAENQDYNKYLYDFNFNRLDKDNVKIACKNMKKALKSNATLPFYLTILIVTLIAYFMISDIDFNICINCCHCCK